MNSLGTYLRTERELRQMSLEEVAQVTRIPLRTLQHIEGDNFKALPGEVFARGFLKSYAHSLGLPEDDVLSRYRAPGATPSTVSIPATAIDAPERGRRFGIAIALVILLILFTLALSIVLRPRRQLQGIELSVAPAAVAIVDVDLA